MYIVEQLSPSDKTFGGAHIVKKVQQMISGIDIPMIVTTVMMRKFVSIICKTMVLETKDSKNATHYVALL